MLSAPRPGRARPARGHARWTRRCERKRLPHGRRPASRSGLRHRGVRWGGSGLGVLRDLPVHHGLRCQQRPIGENPTGTVRIDSVSACFGRTTIATYNVTCLAVVGHQATIGGVLVPNPFSPLPANALFYVEDGVGGAPDRAGPELAPTAPLTCPAPPFDETKTDASVTGELTVHDAVAMPTEPRQLCFGGGWRSYGFESLGKCLAFVFKARLCELLEERPGHLPKFWPADATSLDLGGHPRGRIRRPCRGPRSRRAVGVGDSVRRLPRLGERDAELERGHPRGAEAEDDPVVGQADVEPAALVQPVAVRQVLRSRRERAVADRGGDQPLLVLGQFTSIRFLSRRRPMPPG